MLCHRGCGLPGIHQNKSEFWCCDVSQVRCPIVKAKIGAASGETRRRNPVRHSLEVRQRRSTRLKEAWAEGRRGKPETMAKIKASLKANHAQHPRAPWNKDLRGAQIPWNKGVNMPRKKVIAHDDPVYTDMSRYRHRVGTHSLWTYKRYRDELNPTNLLIGKAGIAGAYQIDHIVGVAVGYQYSIPIELMAAKENLRLIPWRENLRKYDRIEPEYISEAIMEYLVSKGIDVREYQSIRKNQPISDIPRT